MAVMTGSSMLPAQPVWGVKVTIIHDWDVAYPCTSVNGEEDYGPEATASFQSCFKTVSITNNARLRNMLLSESPMEELGLIQFGGTSDALSSSWNQLMGVNSSQVFGSGIPAAETASEVTFDMMQTRLDATIGLDTTTGEMEADTSPASHAGGFGPASPSFSSSPPFPLRVASNFNSPTLGRDNGSPAFDVHSPALNLTPGLPDSSIDGGRSRDSPAGMGNLPNLDLEPAVPLWSSPGPVAPGRGSLAAMRLQASRAGSKIAVFIGLVGAERRGFFEPNVALRATPPSLSDILRALKNGPGIGIQPLLNALCANLGQVPCRISWSRKLVELNDDYTSVTNGYSEVGQLADHLQMSSVLVSRAEIDSVSRATFTMWQLSSDVPLYVLYIHESASSPANTIDSRLRSVESSRSRSHTPYPVRGSTATHPLAVLCKIITFLDTQYLAEGFELTTLSQRRFGAAYLQVRQALVIERVFATAREAHPEFPLTFQDVAAWAGLNPDTYANNRTFARHTRAVLQYLRFSLSVTDTQQESPDVRSKRVALEIFLSVFFTASLLKDDWRADASPITLEVGGARVKAVKKRTQDYPPSMIDSYKHQPFRTC
ncbi:hypothetical protein DFH09DRAFT_1323867 [Mycena vulgaris]|nr:hypothetical protein DFH09DRAFT_1323867 [Mycena vulgaris]